MLEGLSGKNSDKEGTAREGRQRSGIFILACDHGTMYHGTMTVTPLILLTKLFCNTLKSPLEDTFDRKNIRERMGCIIYLFRKYCGLRISNPAIHHVISV